MSDGVLFYELLSTVYGLISSQDFFDLDAISLDVKNTWALKLGNLRKLKKNLDRYSVDELHLKTTKFDRIDLPLIARTGNPAELLKLFEYVMLVIVNCPQKHIFIKRIMDLEEYVQVQLMFLIQKVMGSDEENSEESQTQKRELDSLRQERKKLTDQVADLESELSVAHEEYAVVHSNYQQLKVEYERLNYDLDRRADNEEKETKAIQMDLRTRLSEKDETIFELRKVIEKNKKKYESEIAQLKDDLDITNNKLMDAASNEKMIAQYKKRLEALSSTKQTAEELQKEKDSILATLNNQKAEYESLTKIKASYGGLKDALEQEKLKTEAQSFSLESKDKQIKKLEKSRNDFREKALFFQKKCEELEQLDVYQESSNLSEESFSCHFDKDLLTVNKQKPANVADHLDNMTKDFNKQKALTETRKTKLKCLKERLRMLLEDYLGKALEGEEVAVQLRSSIEILQNDNYYLSEQIQKMTESLKEKENDLFMHNQIIEELESVKSSKLTLMTEYKALLSEKEKLSRTYTETSSKVLEHKSSITSKDSRIYDLQDKLKQAQEQLKAMKTHEEIYKKQLAVMEHGQDSDPSSKFQSENIQLKQEIASISARETLLDSRVNELLKENEEISVEWQDKLRTAQENFAKEIKKKDEDMIRQIEEATIGLMSQRDQLACRLQSERRNSLMNFQRAMSIKELPLPGARDVFKLRDALALKEKEIVKLNRNNKELKNCWRQTAKLLKAVSKELGCETTKIEEAVKERLSV